MAILRDLIQFAGWLVMSIMAAATFVGLCWLVYGICRRLFVGIARIWHPFRRFFGS